MAETKQQKLSRQTQTTSPDIKELMQRMANGLQGETTLSALEWVRQSPNSLTIDTELTENEWLALVGCIEAIQRRYQWYLGDAMVYGIRREYGATDDQIQRVVELTGKAAPTLHEYYKTALLFQIHERSDNLDFEQHRVLAIEFSQDTPEDKAARLTWLKIAEDESLSGRKLRAAIQQSQLPAGTGAENAQVDNPPPPALSGEIRQREARALPPRVTIRERREQVDKLFDYWRRDNLKAMPRDDLFMIREWINDLWEARRKIE